jgi:hypothetical protein
MTKRLPRSIDTSASNMTNSDWWDRAKLPPRPAQIEIRKRERLCTLRNGEHEITLERRDVPALGEELSVNAVWRRMRVFRPHGAMLGAAVGATVATLEARGWRQSGPVVTWPGGAIVTIIGRYGITSRHLSLGQSRLGQLPGQCLITPLAEFFRLLSEAPPIMVPARPTRCH